MSNLNFDELAEKITEYFRVCAILGYTRSIGNEKQLSQDQVSVFNKRAQAAQARLHQVSVGAIDGKTRQDLESIIELGRSLRGSTGTGKAYRYSAADYLVIAGRLLGGLEPLPR